MSATMKALCSPSYLPLDNLRRLPVSYLKPAYGFCRSRSRQVAPTKAVTSPIDVDTKGGPLVAKEDRVGSLNSKKEGKSRPAQWSNYLHSYMSPVATGIGLACLTLSAPLPGVVPFLLAAAGALALFAVNPVMDVLLGPESVNPSKEEIHELTRDQRFKWVLRYYVPLQLLTALYGYWFLTTQNPSWAVVLGVLFSLGANGAVGFTVAHELVHSPDKFDQNLAAVQLASMCYPHWSLSHLAHHAQVATPEDPASAHHNEPLWVFIPRSIVGNLRDGFLAETRRLRDTRTPFWSLRNRMWMWLAAPAAMVGALWLPWGWAAVGAFLGQSLAAVMLLEAVNYVEHYGLTRRKLPSGRYEKVAARHSWNADFIATNCVSFRLQRHADHHLHATRPYQALVSMTEEAPQLPYSYPIMVMLACIPPLWFRVMNPTLEAEQRRLDALERSRTAAALQPALMDEPCTYAGG